MSRPRLKCGKALGRAEKKLLPFTGHGLSVSMVLKAQVNNLDYKIDLDLLLLIWFINIILNIVKHFAPITRGSVSSECFLVL